MRQSDILTGANQEQYLANVYKLCSTRNTIKLVFKSKYMTYGKLKKATTENSVLWQMTQESSPCDIIQGKVKKNIQFKTMYNT